MYCLAFLVVWLWDKCGPSSPLLAGNGVSLLSCVFMFLPGTCFLVTLDSQSQQHQLLLTCSQFLSHAAWGHLRRQVTVESSDKTWSAGEANGKLLQYSCLENPRAV